MPTNVLMPKWGMSMQQGTVTAWLKQQGDTVAEGEEIVEIESDKAVDLVTAPAAGVLARILVAEGEVAPISTVIAVIASPGEGLQNLTGPEQRQASASSEQLPPSLGTGAKHARATPKTQPRGHRVAASPAARRLARKYDIDLNEITGSGPDGMIVADDVQAARHRESECAASGTAAPSGRQHVSFYSDGHKLDGRLYLPASATADQPAPGVVFCLGYTYLKELLVPEMAKRLCAAGYACLIFDYRGFGNSEGPRGRVFPTEQVTDIRAAVTFLAAQPPVDSRRISLAGISLGGSHALYTAAVDPRVHSAAAFSPIGDGRRWLRGNRPYWQWRQFLDEIDRDRTATVLTGKGAHVGAWEIVAPDPSSQSFLDDLLREFPSLRCMVSLESAGALIDYCPESVAARIAPRRVLLVHGENDLLVPPDESRNLLAHCEENCRLVTLPGVGHFDWGVTGTKAFDHVMEVLTGWLRENVVLRPPA